MSLGLRPLRVGITVASLMLLAAGAVVAGDATDRRYLNLPPIYPAPTRGFVPRPSSVAPMVPRDPGAPADRPAWTPGHTEVLMGLDDQGRLTHVQEYTPGRFER